MLGNSRVEKNPAEREFYFYIACEIGQNLLSDCNGLMYFSVTARRWAVFSNHTENGMRGETLQEAELYSYMEWLKNLGLSHAKTPELEVYTEKDSTLDEYWLPIQNSEKRK